MENNGEEKVAGTILTSGERACGGNVPDIDDPSIQVDEALGAYEGEEGVPPGPGEILSRGDLVRIKAQIELALTSAEPASSEEIYEVIVPIVDRFNFPPVRERERRVGQAIHGTGSVLEDAQDIIKYLDTDDGKCAIVVNTRYVRIYCKLPFFNWVKDFFTA